MAPAYTPTQAERVEQVLAVFVHRAAARRKNEAHELLQRAAAKAAPRRFAAVPVAHSAFGSLA
jgi:hypothetical protein